jgi:hypothetical protein
MKNDNAVTKYEVIINNENYIRLISDDGVHISIDEQILGIIKEKGLLHEKE